MFENASRVIKMKNAWDTFTKNHPRFPLFMDAVNQNGLTEGTIIEIQVKTKDGKNLCTNLKLTESDVELLKEMSKK